MIRSELFFDTVSYRLGLELQCFRFNFQTSLGFSLLWEAQAYKMTGSRAASAFVGLGPIAVVGWIDPR